MKKWLIRALLLGLFGFFVLAIYGHYRAGYFDLPDLPDGAYHISFTSGLRAIVLEPTVTHDLSDDPQFTRTLSRANPERRYIGFPMEVESWFEDAWSTCIPPTEQEIADVKNWHEDVQKKIANARFDAVCWLDVDGKKIPRGVIFSVPRL